MLKPDIYKAGSTRQEVFRAELGLASKGKEELARDADNLFATLTHSGEAGKAAVLEALITFYDGSDTGSLEAALRLNPGTGYGPLAWYLLGDHYERKGFYPEAEGYYNRLYKEAPKGAARTAALFQLSRIRYFKGEYEAALVELQRAYERLDDHEVAAHIVETLVALDRRDEALAVLVDAESRHTDSSLLQDVRDRLFPDAD
jgi:tetratricopeptide (TPR) repeat protein